MTTWVECGECAGGEGWYDSVNDCWVDCDYCAGEGGWNDYTESA